MLLAPPSNMPSTPAKPAFELSSAPVLPGRLLLMPAAYLPKAKKRLSSTAILVMVLLFVAVLVGVVVFLFVTRETPAAPIAQVPVAETPVTPQPTPTTPEPTPTQPVPTTPVTPVVDIPQFVSGSLPTSVDTDQDSLSDVEEQLFLTSVAVPDTDQDGFLDGIELRNQYDPATPRALLEVSPQVKIVRNDPLGYQLLVPVKWTASSSTNDGKEFLIRPDQGSEAFRINVYDNVERVTVTEWFQKQQPNANLTQFVNFKNEAGWVGIQTQDHRLIIASLDDGGPGSRAYMFVLYYDAGQETEARYSAVLDMMANSLAVASRVDT